MRRTTGIRSPRKRAVVYAICGLATLFMLAFPVQVLAQAKITVVGTVIGTGNVAKGLARIELTGPGQFVAMSNATGQFNIPGVIPGDYNVTVRQGGNYQTIPVKIGDAPLQLRVNW